MGGPCNGERICIACKRKCSLRHSHGNSKDNTLSFFIVMDKKSYHFAEIPSLWGEQLRLQGCRQVILEGPSGCLWHTTLCCCGASAFFKNGWENFVSDHSIQPQDLMVFRNVTDTHFLVQIFDLRGNEKTVTTKNRDMSTVCNIKIASPKTLSWSCKDRIQISLSRECPIIRDREEENECQTQSSLPSKTHGHEDHKPNVLSQMEDLVAKHNDLCRKLQESCKGKIQTCLSKEHPIILNREEKIECQTPSPLASKTHHYAEQKPNVIFGMKNPMAKHNVVAWKLQGSCDVRNIQTGHSRENPIILDTDESFECQTPSSLSSNIHCSGDHKPKILSGMEDLIAKDDDHSWRLQESCRSKIQTSNSREKPIIILNREEEMKCQTLSSLAPNTHQYGEHKPNVRLGMRGRIPKPPTSGLPYHKPSNIDELKFSKRMTKYALTYPFTINLPTNFARRWLPYPRANVILLCHGIQWPVTFLATTKNCRLGPGWKAFALGNQLKLGDACFFEFKGTDNHVFEVRISQDGYEHYNPT